MSRITISLKSSVEEMTNVDVVRPVLPSMFTQHSRMDVASNIKIVAPGFNQTKTVDSMDFGLEMSAKDLRWNQPTNRGGAVTILSPNRPKLNTINQESSDWERSLSATEDSSGFNSIEERQRL